MARCRFLPASVYGSQSLEVVTNPLLSPMVPAETAAPVLVVDDDTLLRTPPHIHLAAVSLIVTATTFYALAPTEALTATKRAPLGGQSFAFLRFSPEASIRVFMLPHQTMTILKPDTLWFGGKRFKGPPGVPLNYSLALAFDYPSGSEIWTIFVDRRKAHTSTFGFGPPIPEAVIDGAGFTGYARPFELTPASFRSGIQVPAIGERAVSDSPGGTRMDYTPMMFVTTPNKNPLKGSSIFCEALDFDDLRGSVVVDGNSRSVDGAFSLAIPSALAELHFSVATSSLSVLARGSSSSLKLDGVQLVPTRAGRFGLQEPLVAAVVAALLASIIIILFVTRGHAVYQWLHPDR
jgi:hypothetical protein